MTIQGVKRVVKEVVLFALADTLASHSMGGFKVSVGFALPKCRMCLATRDQLSTKVGRTVWAYSSLCTTIWFSTVQGRRLYETKPWTYNYHCALLDGLLSYEDSITYGVNTPSPLNDIENFHVTRRNSSLSRACAIIAPLLPGHAFLRVLTYWHLSRISLFPPF